MEKSLVKSPSYSVLAQGIGIKEQAIALRFAVCMQLRRQLSQRSILQTWMCISSTWISGPLERSSIIITRGQRISALNSQDAELLISGKMRIKG